MRTHLGFSHERCRSYDIQRCHTDDLLLVVDIVRFHDLSSDGHSGVHWIGDDGNHGAWTVLCTGSDQISHDRCISIEQIIARHSYNEYFIQLSSSVEEITNLVFLAHQRE